MIIWQCIFWLCVLLIMHSYLLFPWLLQILASNKKENSEKYPENEFPSLTVLMSVYNEQKVLEEKLNSLLASNYPLNKINILIGSDASEDGTGEILNEFQNTHSKIKAIHFKERQGKPAVINSLMKEVKDEIVIMTDAKVIFHPDTIRGLAAHF